MTQLLNGIFNTARRQLSTWLIHQVSLVARHRRHWSIRHFLEVWREINYEKHLITVQLVVLLVQSVYRKFTLNFIAPIDGKLTITAFCKFIALYNFSFVEAARLFRKKFIHEKFYNCTREFREAAKTDIECALYVQRNMIEEEDWLLLIAPQTSKWISFALRNQYTTNCWKKSKSILGCWLNGFIHEKVLSIFTLLRAGWLSIERERNLEFHQLDNHRNNELDNHLSSHPPNHSTPW